MFHMKIALDMQTATMRDLRLHTPAVLKKLKRGPVFITRRGVPVAKITAPEHENTSRNLLGRLAHMRIADKTTPESFKVPEGLSLW